MDTSLVPNSGNFWKMSSLISLVPQYGKLRDAVLDQGDFIFPISIGDRVVELTNQLKEKKQSLDKNKKKN